MNPDLLAAVNPAIRELNAAWSAGKKNLCLTIENAKKKQRWVQVVDNGLNVGLVDGEGPDDVKVILHGRNQSILAEEAGAGKYYFAKLNVRLDKEFVELVCDILARKDIKYSDAVNVVFEEL